MTQEVLNLTPGGAPLAQSLGFTAATVIVDNLTSSYVTLSDVGKTIPPWVYGAVVALPPGLRRATAKLTATVPAIPGPPVPISQATFAWTDQLLPADPGHLLQQSSLTQPQLIDQALNVAPNGTVTHNGIAIPAGTQSLMALSVDPASGNPAGTIGITGVTTAQEYIGTDAGHGFPSSLGNGLGQPIFFPAIPADTAVNVQYAADAAGESFWLFALAVPMAVAVLNNVAAVITSQNGSPVFMQSQGPNSREVVAVTLSEANPALWQAPSAFIRFGATINAGATAALRAGVAGQVIRIFGPVFTSDAGAGNATDVISLEDTVGNLIEDFRNTSAIQPGCPGPLPVAVGNGIRLHNFSAANLAVRCTLGVSQG